jgi:curved DNA-binding protein CbpA
METLDFNDLEFNLYELMNLPFDCSYDDVKVKFRKLIKKFHPDKITKIEEKIYYNLTLAHHILSTPKIRKQYDEWLTFISKEHTDLKSGFKQAQEEVKKYFPKTQKDAVKDYDVKSKQLWERHGGYKEDRRDMNIIYSEYNNTRSNLNEIEKESFNNTDDFNNKFTERKEKGGKYSDKLIKYDKKTQIIPYNNSNSSLSFVKLEDFNKMYLEDPVIGSYYASLSLAFKLQPNFKLDKSRNIEKNMNKYKQQTEELKNIHNNLDNFNL